MLILEGVITAKFAKDTKNASPVINVFFRDLRVLRGSIPDQQFDLYNINV